MFGSEILEVAIGIIFVYLLVSLICSAGHELIEGLWKWRAKDLERGIRELLHHKVDGGKMVSDLYQHPLIAGLYKRDYKKGGNNLPSYIPARTFVMALLDVIFPAGAQDPGGTAGTTPPTPLPADSNPAPAINPILPPNALDQLRAKVDALTNAKVKGALLPLIAAAGNDAAKMRENVENWFNSGMDRVSGWYKRRTQLIIFLLGLVIASIFNLDSIAIVRKLYTDKSARDVVVAAAQDYVKTHPAAQNQGGGTTGDGSDSANKAAIQKQIDVPLGQVEKLGLTFDWKTELERHNDPNSKDSQAFWPIKIIGIILTGLAASLGAPFWFDMLNKFIVVRSTVKPREKSPDEPSKS